VIANGAFLNVNNVNLPQLGNSVSSSAHWSQIVTIRSKHSHLLTPSHSYRDDEDEHVIALIVWLATVVTMPMGD
jgi:hypothetical protein